MNEIFTRIPPDAKPGHAARDLEIDPSLGSFEDVSYTYLGSDEPAIEHMSFHIAAGQTTSIVGLSGTGKSTALGLFASATTSP